MHRALRDTLHNWVAYFRKCGVRGAAGDVPTVVPFRLARNTAFPFWASVPGAPKPKRIRDVIVPSGAGDGENDDGDDWIGDSSGSSNEEDDSSGDDDESDKLPRSAYFLLQAAGDSKEFTAVGKHPMRRRPVLPGDDSPWRAIVRGCDEVLDALPREPDGSLRTAVDRARETAATTQLSRAVAAAASEAARLQAAATVKNISIAIYEKDLLSGRLKTKS